MNKRGYQNTQGFLMGLIVLLAVLLVLVVFYGRLGEIAQDKEAEQTCRQHIEVSAIGRVGGIPLYDIGKCPTEYITNDDDDVEEIKHALASEMAQCWYKLGEGQYEIFDLNLGKTQYCVICSVIEFEGPEETIPGFLTYLGEEMAPLTYTKGEVMSYADYLHGYKSDPAVQLLYEDETTDVIDTSFDYATIFLYAKHGHVNKIWSTYAGLAVGTVGGALILSGAGAPVGIGLLAGSAAAGVGGAALGYDLGSDTSATWEAGILLYPYETAALDQLDCEVLPVEQ